jgi:hypothetical protein
MYRAAAYALNVLSTTRAEPTISTLPHYHDTFSRCLRTRERKLAVRDKYTGIERPAD